VHDETQQALAAQARGRKSRPITWLVVAYVATVLGVDALATMGVQWGVDWRMFNWGAREAHAAAAWAHAHLGLSPALTEWLRSDVMRQFDWFKFVWWFCVPFLISLPWMVWSALSPHRWKWSDLLVLAGLAGIGMAVMFLIPFVPALREIYPGMGHLSEAEKWAIFQVQLLWVVSWLPGWEFMHRYFLLDRVSLTWPRWGWLLLPLMEGAYHLQKPGLEALGMVLFSIILTRWAMKRANVLLPFTAHLIIEIELIVFLLLW